jgi:hypothetical protein
LVREAIRAEGRHVPAWIEDGALAGLMGALIEFIAAAL